MKYKYRARLKMPNGSTRNIYAHTKSELEEKRLALREEIKAIEKTGVIRSKCPTVEAYATKQLGFLKKTVKYGTYIGYESKVKQYIINGLGPNKLLCDITPDDIKEATLNISQLSPSTCRTVLMLYKRIFRAAVNSKIIESDPTELLEINSQQQHIKKRALSDEEVDILLAAVKGLSVEPFIKIALETGMRREEILALQWDCVFLEEEYPYIKVKKVKRAWRIEHNRPVVSETLKSAAARRDIPISETFAEYLREMKANASQTDYVISNSSGNALSGSQWRNLWKQVTRRMVQPRSYVRYADGNKQLHSITPELGKAAKHNPDVVYSIPFFFTPHQLRHTAITNWVDRSISIKTVQQVAGHENVKMTLDIYAECKYKSPEELSKAMFGVHQE